MFGVVLVLVVCSVCLHFTGQEYSDLPGAWPATQQMGYMGDWGDRGDMWS